VQGSVVSLDAEALRKEPNRPTATLIFAPTQQEFAQEVAVTKTRLGLTILEHVQGLASIYSPSASGAWTQRKLHVPDNVGVEIVDADTASDHFFLRLTGFLTPSSLLLGDAAGAEPALAKSLPAQFDASRDMVEQFEAVSKDGTKVPSFVVHRRDLQYDGSNPTLMSAYGGFQVSKPPYYSGVTGKLWLERGGVFVLANIRRGGEFGPA